ncbi:MAG TPA: GtrA family protein [Catenuloplanes sp.]|jgi:putative flippase GtrA
MFAAARLLPERLRRLAPEAFAFGVIGAANSLLYFVIFNAAMGIGAVKSTVLATVVTTTLSYFANRHWTYKHRPRSALRREYTLFFAFNFAGLVIQSGAVAIGKYGLGYTEDRHRLAFNLFTLIGVALATVFRFWAYRTFVFLKFAPGSPAPAVVAAMEPADRPLDLHALAHLDPVAELAEAVVEHRAPGTVAPPHPRAGEPPTTDGLDTDDPDGLSTDDPDGLDAGDPDGLDAEIAAEINAARRPAAR